MEYKFRHKNDLPIVIKKFSDVAKLAIADMRKQLDAGLGRKVFTDYIVCIERYLIPFFGAQYVTTIDYERVQQFYEWRRAKMGREPKASTLNTHNSAMNRVFEEAVARGFIAHKNVPLLVNRGEKSERRPDFTREEYATLICKLPSWINARKAGKPTDMRHLMRDYVLIMANTGMRHGTEALNLKWKHVSLFEEKDLQYLEMSVTGKTGRRNIICRSEPSTTSSAYMSGLRIYGASLLKICSSSVSICRCSDCPMALSAKTSTRRSASSSQTQD